MLYKILLTLNSPSNSVYKYSKSTEKLTQNNWKQLDDSNKVWISEIIANDLLSAKIRVERDLNLFFFESGLYELSYAFQLSLSDVSIGKINNNLFLLC
ncbi:MAG: hypothetical protein HYU67_00720 [Flavobacteriia bacterium]|nr:hypothetical protein [Flavobacteriia bacterium]